MVLMARPFEVTGHFRRVAARVVDAVLEASPEAATDLGDHRFDDRLSDLSPAGVEQRVAMLDDALAALDEVDDTQLDTEDGVDLEILRAVVVRDLWTAQEWRPFETDPLAHLPGEALYPLLAREVGEPADRLRAITARLAGVPEALRVAREVLHDMPRIHVETAIGQARGAIGMLGADVDALLERAPDQADAVDEARSAAAEALRGHVAWLESQLPVSDGDPRLGDQVYAARLWYTLDTETGPDALLDRAESDLLATEEAIAELASDIDGAPPRPGQVREVLDRLAAEQPTTDETVVGTCRDLLAELTERVRELDLVGIPPMNVEIITMPPSRRGVVVAYCDPPGPLEPPGPDGVPLPTLFAVSPTPEDWDAEHKESFYREYNGHMLRNLTVHEAMPGHALQLAHAAGFSGGTQVRTAFRSGPFVEGWAVYTEALMAQAAAGEPTRARRRAGQALRMQQLKMQLRVTVNAILDVRVHARGMTEAEAMSLMVDRGHMEAGEAAGKWRRAQLTSAQLSTYYVGYHEVRRLVRDLREQRPEARDRTVHDAVLAHGSPPPRHLRTLLGLADGQQP
jgi:uncharacterized protein (DUF885 family)